MARYRKVRKVAASIEQFATHTESNVSFKGNVYELQERINSSLTFEKAANHNEHLLNFADVPNTETANLWLLNGSSEFLNKYLESTGEQFNISLPTASNNLYVNDNEGLFIDIDAVNKGLPECWLNDQKEHNNKFLKIVVNVTVMHTVSNDVIFEKYKHVFKLIDNLESTGTRTQLVLKVTATPSNEMRNAGAKKYSNELLVKNYSDVLNIQQAVYLIASPYFLRYATLLIGATIYGTKCGLYYSDVNDEADGLIEDTLFIPSFYFDSERGRKNDYYKELAENIILETV